MEQPKRLLKVDLDELQFVFESGFEEFNHFLDLESGDVVMVGEEANWQLESLWKTLGEEASLDAIAAAIQELELQDWQKDELLTAAQVEMDYGVRFIAIPRADSRDGYQDMQAFIATVKNDRLADRLERAIHGRGAFRRFKDVLGRYPQERDRWFQFQTERLRARVLGWLEDQGIEPNMKG